MFDQLEYRQECLEQMYSFRAKLLAIIGQVNASHPHEPASEMMETVMNVQKALLESWARGDMCQVTVSMFSLGKFREEGANLEPFDGLGEHHTANNPPGELPF